MTLVRRLSNRYPGIAVPELRTEKWTRDLVYFHVAAAFGAVPLRETRQSTSGHCQRALRAASLQRSRLGAVAVEMAVKACLNGARTRTEHPAVPRTPGELAADAIAVRRAGAFAVHVHPRDSGGAQTLKAVACDAAVEAIRVAVPGLPVGLSTAEAIDPDPFARAAAVKTWRQPPDFISVNLSELGWPGIVRAALHAGIAVEAGLATPADAEELVRSPFTHQVVRALVEVDGGVEDARAIARLIPDGVPQLWHGYGERTWEVISAAGTAAIDVRVGFEDVLALPDGRTPASNADLVAAAVELIGRQA